MGIFQVMGKQFEMIDHVRLSKKKSDKGLNLPMEKEQTSGGSVFAEIQLTATIYLYSWCY